MGGATGAKLDKGGGGGMTSQYFFKSQESLATVIDIDEEEDLEEDPTIDSVDEVAKVEEDTKDVEGKKENIDDDEKRN